MTVLLEDRPRNEASTEAVIGWARRNCYVGKKTNAKCVAFSVRSSLHVYAEDDSYAADKSYTESDVRGFKKEVVAQAIRIRKTLIARRSEDLSSQRGSPTSGSELLASCGIPREEALGIEQLALQHPTKVMKRRETHTRAILMEQAKQRRAGTNDDGRLARLSAAMARKPVVQARRRAAMAA